ncbi:MAG TPA: DNA-3-methyladenine glycosylase 2 family protein [Actinomycetota bacterium]|nr:DNA-3-methyladenine glycosylase 2 family protein [Actinomycetota bacterium]
MHAREAVAPERTSHVETVIRPRLPIDLGLTLWPLGRGARDLSVRADRDGAWWRATRTPEGPVTTRFEQRADGIHAWAWGPGAAWAIEAAPDLLGARDSLESFEPARGLVRDLHRRFPGLRIGRSRAVFEAMLPSIIEQKVVGLEAGASYRALLRSWGEAAPGPFALRLPPRPEVVAEKRPFEFHPLGIEARRALAIREAARNAGRLEEAVWMGPPAALDRLRAVPGIGPWTAARVAMTALGDADAVAVGDYHLPHIVAWALAGEPRGTDARMLDLLEPYRGHRARVLRLLLAAGIEAPRFGPKMPIRSIARW